MDLNATPSSKRPRAPSSPSSLSTSPGSANPPFKASRIISFPSTDSDIISTFGSSDSTAKVHNHTNAGSTATAAPLLCNLPPTCHRQPTPIANTTELERHYAKYHAHVCEERGCGCVFPEARLLELHQTECHDPLARIRKERGEKIFQCHIAAPTCGRNFLTPKARRLHLIQSHSYPKEYFFAVTNKGIGGLLKKWGEGASMVRKEWKQREPSTKDVDRAPYRDHEDNEMDDAEEGDEDGDDRNGEDEDKDKPFEEIDNSIDVEATPRMLPRTTGIQSPPSLVSSSTQPTHSQHQRNQQLPTQARGNDVDNLVNSLDSLSLVPNSIRFGRGGKTAGFMPNTNVSHARGRGRGRGRGHGDFAHSDGRDNIPSGTPAQEPVSDTNIDHSMPVDSTVPTRSRGRGRGGPRGRARGIGRGRGAYTFLDD